MRDDNLGHARCYSPRDNAQAYLARVRCTLACCTLRDCVMMILFTHAVILRGTMHKREAYRARGICNRASVRDAYPWNAYVSAYPIYVFSPREVITSMRDAWTRIVREVITSMRDAYPRIAYHFYARCVWMRDA